MGQPRKAIKIQNLCAAVAMVFVFAIGESVYAHAQDTTDASDVLPPQQNSSELGEMKAERAQFVKEIRHVESLNQRYTKEIEDIRTMLSEKDADFQKRMNDLEGQLSAQKDEKSKKTVADEQTQQTTQELADKTNEMLAKGVDLNPQDEKFKEELGKAHYNMGNIYFERGEYQRAVVEYYQAADLMPNDPDTHYNLAFVSGEYLGDQETALKHYQWYLYLKPNATDVALVKEKILQAKLSLRSKIDSTIDKNDGNFNLTR